MGSVLALLARQGLSQNTAFKLGTGTPFPDKVVNLWFCQGSWHFLHRGRPARPPGLVPFVPKKVTFILSGSNGAVAGNPGPPLSTLNGTLVSVGTGLAIPSRCFTKAKGPQVCVWTLSAEAYHDSAGRTKRNDLLLQGKTNAVSDACRLACGIRLSRSKVFLKLLFVAKL
eukprot:3388329-Amphidinium_carterae.1